MVGQHDPPSKAKSVLERLGGRKAETSESDESVRDSYDSSRRNSEDDLMLDVRLSNGGRCALAYGTLLKVEYSPADQLKLAFATETVVIEGRKLLPLYELLRRHRAKFVQEGTGVEDGLKPEDAPHIDSIYFEQPKEDL